MRTVLGDVAAGAWTTYCHEHVITRPAARFGDDLRLDEEGRAAAASMLGEDPRDRYLLETFVPHPACRRPRRTDRVLLLVDNPSRFLAWR